jgi:Dolichyl-phosphate-mannose-protein mannosyltransferase
MKLIISALGIITVLTLLERRCNTLNRIIAHRRFIPVCLFLGTVIRLLWIWLVDAPQVLDFFWYQQFARNIADGKGYTLNGIPTGYWPIGYPGLLGIIFYVVGESLLVGKVLNIVLYIGAVFLTYRLSQRLFHCEYAARVTVCLLCFYPNHIAYTALLSSEILFVFLVALSAFAFEAARGRAGFLMLSGMFWGLAALTKPQALVLPFLFPLFFSGSVRSFVRSSVLVYCMVLITVSPWLIRNHSVFGAHRLAHTGGINLLVGNNPYSTGGEYFTDKVNALLGDLQTVPFQNAFDGKEVERDTRAKNIAIDYMIHNPGRVFGLLPRKLLALFKEDTEGLWFSMGMMPGSKSYAAPLDTLARGLWLPPSALEGRTDILYKNISRLCRLYYVLIIALFAISLPIVLKLPIRPQHIGLAIIVSLTLVYLVLFGQPRFHFSMMPWVAIYSGLGAQILLLGKSSLRIAESGEVPTYHDHEERKVRA